MLTVNVQLAAATPVAARSLLPFVGGLLAVAGSVLLVTGMMVSPSAPIVVRAAAAPARSVAGAVQMPVSSPRREIAIAPHVPRLALEAPRRESPLYSGEGRTFDILADSRRPSLDMMLAERAATHSAFRRRWETDNFSSSLAADPRAALMAMAEGDRSRHRIGLGELPVPVLAGPGPGSDDRLADSLFSALSTPLDAAGH